MTLQFAFLAMSYVLHLWEHPVPASVGDADRIHARLSSQRAAQNPKFIELARRLTARYPCITTLDDDAEAAWSDGPLDGRTDSAVYSLGVNTGMLDKVVPFVVSTAGSLGLIVYDMQAGEVHLPGGKLLSLPGRAPATWAHDGSPPALQSKAQVAEVIRDGLRGLMEEHGFRTLKGEVFFRKRLAGCTHEVLFDMGEPGGKFDLDVSYWVVPKLDSRLDEVVRTCTVGGCFVDLTKVGEQTGHAAPGRRVYSATRRWDITSVPSLVRAIDELRAFLAAAVLPVMAKCDTIDALDHMVNGLPSADRLFIPSHMSVLVAHAAHNPRLASVIEERLHAPEAARLGDKLSAIVSTLDGMRKTDDQA